MRAVGVVDRIVAPSVVAIVCLHSPEELMEVGSRYQNRGASTSSSSRLRPPAPSM
jgi:hypothetical protein